MTIWKKKEKYVDLSEKMRKQEERLENFKSGVGETNSQVPQENQSSGGFFSFFGGSGDKANVTSSGESSFESSEQRKKKLAKRLSDMTSKMEDLENQMYHLKQKVEVLERKQKIGY